MIYRATIKDLDFINETMPWDELKEIFKEKKISYESLIKNNSIYFLILVSNDKKAGVCQATPSNLITYELHISILPEYRGKEAIRLGKEGIKWMFNNTNALKLIGMTPIFKYPAYVYSKRCGFKDEGLNRQSCLNNGKLYDQFFTGITKAEILQRESR